MNRADKKELYDLARRLKQYADQMVILIDDEYEDGIIDRSFLILGLAVELKDRIEDLIL